MQINGNEKKSRLSIGFRLEFYGIQFTLLNKKKFSIQFKKGVAKLLHFLRK